MQNQTVRKNVVWAPQPGPQTLFCQCPIDEALFGGMAGGGKTDALCGDAVSGIETYGSAWSAVIFRRTYKQLEEIERRMMEMLAPVYGASCYKRGRHVWEIPTRKGEAVIALRSMEHPEDVYDHQGHEYTYCAFDELTQWPTPHWIEYLWTRLRSAKGVPVFMRATANPGGVGHHWVKERFRIGENPPLQPFKVKVGGETKHRVFIPSRLEDNKKLMENDPGYAARLESIADPVLRRALRYGDWNIVAGAAFPEFNPHYHVVPTREVPRGVPIWRSMDWGYTKPYCCLWAYSDHDGRIVVCGELYGRGPRVGQGSRESEEEVAEKILRYERDRGWQVVEAFLDPQCWAEIGGGLTTADKLGGQRMGWQPWPKGQDSRIAQKREVHSLLRVVNGRATMVFMDCCGNLIRTLSALPADETNPEDVDTNAEDHAYDALRGLAARNTTAEKYLDELNNSDPLLWTPGRLDGGDGPYYGGW
jgi:hypothetical protein